MMKNIFQFKMVPKKMVTYKNYSYIKLKFISSGSEIEEDRMDIVKINECMADVYEELTSTNEEEEKSMGQHEGLRTYLALPLTRWPDGQVPYVINSALGEEGKNMVLNAMDQVSQLQ